jgi:hypothetical protein
MSKKTKIRAEAQEPEPASPRSFTINDLKKLAWVGAVVTLVLAAISSLAQWLQGVHILAVVGSLVLMLFSMTFVYVNVVRKWERCSSAQFDRRATMSLIVVGAAHGAIVALLVILDPPDLGSLSFTFAGMWMVVTAFVVSAARERAAQQVVTQRLSVVAFRSGLTTIGMTIVALACGDGGLMVRELMRDNAPQAVFFFFQTTFLVALAFLLLQGRRRGVGIGFVAVGVALLGTGVDLLARGALEFGGSFVLLSAATIILGGTALRRASYGFGAALCLAGIAVAVLGFAARADGVLPFFILYVFAGASVVLVGLLILLFPDAVVWNTSARTGRAVFLLSLTTSVTVSVLSAVMLAYWLSLEWFGLAISFTGYVVAALILAGGAIWGRVSGVPRPNGRHVPPRSMALYCSSAKKSCAACPRREDAVAAKTA